MEIRVKKAALFLIFTVLAIPAWAKEGQVSSSFSRLLQSSQSLACTFARSDPLGSLSGTSYIAKGKMRGDFKTTQSGTAAVLMHVIHDKEWHYMWGGPFGENKGLKTRASQGGGYAPRGEKFGPDMDETLDLECKPWPPSAGKFQPPADVEFQELAPPLERVPDAARTKAAQCAACEQAPEGPARADCRQMLGCA